MIRRCCPSSLPHTLENRIAFVLILAVALISIEHGCPGTDCLFVGSGRRFGHLCDG